LSLGIELDNAVMAGFAEVTFAIHLCRGNQEGRWLVEGDYEPTARPIFQRIGATRPLLEYDDDRSGSFAPLRHVSDDKMVVLGLLSTKRPQTETPGDLICRIKEANRFVPLERLALSPSAALPLRSLETTSPSRTKDVSLRGCAKLRDGYGDSFLLRRPAGASNCGISTGRCRRSHLTRITATSGGAF
jgi:methionine synthase II (cobalamin-independent)